MLDVILSPDRRAAPESQDPWPAPVGKGLGFSIDRSDLIVA